MPRTSAPRRAIESARMPPPQPTSTTRLPLRAASESIQSRRSGLISCSGRKSLSLSHHRCARSLNLASSCGSALIIVEMVERGRSRQRKSPAERGFSDQRSVLLGARTDHFDFHATVLRAAFGGLVVRDRLLLALAFGVDAVLLDALARQVGLDGFGTTNRQRLVVGVATDRVGVADGDDDFQVQASHLADEVVELGLAFGLENGLVEVEERISGEGDLLAGRGGDNGRS